MTGRRHTAWRPLVRGAAQWTLLLFAMNLVWEVAQLPLYSLGPDVTWPAVAYAVLHCTLGDAGMALGAYLLAALATRAPSWPLQRPAAGLAIAMPAALAYTVWAEWYNVYVVSSWAYAAGMPTVGGIGLAPLLQWIVLPPIALAIVRKWQISRPAPGLPEAAVPARSGGPR